MPIFEYECRACGARFESIVSSAAAKATCKKCGNPEVEKLLSVFAVGGARDSRSAPQADPCSTCGARERGLCEG
jgi:putative FmdB family regulatory protein